MPGGRHCPSRPTALVLDVELAVEEGARLCSSTSAVELEVELAVAVEQALATVMSATSRSIAPGIEASSAARANCHRKTRNAASTVHRDRA